MNDLRATFGDHVRVFAGVPKQGTQSLQIFTPHFATIASSGGAAAKVLWTIQVSKVTFLITLG
jgi:hypothetical protein